MSNDVILWKDDNTDKDEADQYLDLIKDNEKREDFNKIVEQAYEYIAMGAINWKQSVALDWRDKYDIDEIIHFLKYVQCNKYTDQQKDEMRTLVTNKLIRYMNDLEAKGDIQGAAKVLDQFIKLHGLNDVQAVDIRVWSVEYPEFDEAVFETVSNEIIENE